MHSRTFGKLCVLCRCRDRGDPSCPDGYALPFRLRLEPTRASSEMIRSSGSAVSARTAEKRSLSIVRRLELPALVELVLRNDDAHSGRGNDFAPLPLRRRRLRTCGSPV
jgi:hypothetical protein